MNESATPHAAPQPVAASAAAPPATLLAAPPGARFVNWVVDLSAILVLRYASGLLVARWASDSTARFVRESYDQYFFLLVFLGYYLVCEATTSKTLGKALSRTRVVNESGGKPSFSQVLGRTLSRLIPLDGFTFFDDAPRGWHDRLPRTYVVPEARYPKHSD